MSSGSFLSFKAHGGDQATVKKRCGFVSVVECFFQKMYVNICNCDSQDNVSVEKDLVGYKTLGSQLNIFMYFEQPNE